MKRIVLSILSILLVFAVIVFSLVVSEKKEEKFNFFADMIEFEREEYTFALKNFEYGLSLEEVMWLEGLSQENIFSENTTLIREEIYEDVAYGEEGEIIDSLQYKEAYYFDEDFGLYGATYTLYMDPKYEKNIRSLLYEQAIGCMPTPNHYGGYEQIMEGSLLEWDEYRDNTYFRIGKNITGETCVTLKIWINKEGLLEILMSCRISSRSSLWE